MIDFTNIEKHHLVDSFYVYKTDSFFMKTIADTVFVYRYKTLFRDKIKIRTDTVRRDSIVYIEKKIVVEQKQSWVNNLEKWIRTSVFLLAIIAVMFIFLKLKK